MKSPQNQLLRLPSRPMERQAEHNRRIGLLDFGLSVGFPIALLLVWEACVAGGLLDGQIYPPPSRIASALYSLLASGRLWSEVVASTGRILSGYLIGAFAGFLVGSLMGTLPRMKAMLDLTLSALYVVPKLALFPVFLTIFGFGDGSKVALVAVTVFFYVWIASLEGFSHVPEGYKEAARSLQIGPFRTFVHVLLPYVAPSLFVSMRIGMAVSVLVVIASEFVTGNNGIGYLIFNSRSIGIYEWMYAGIVAAAIVGVVFSTIVKWIGYLATPWLRVGTP